METIYSYFRKQVMENPSALAVKDECRALTFNELDALTDTIAERFNGAPKFVGIVMDHGVEMIASMLAVLKVGACYVPVEPFFPEDRIHFIMKECDADFVLTDEKYAKRLDGLNPLVIEKGMEINPDAEVADLSVPEGLAYILYTSGSTGKPKGVMVENRNVCHYIKAFSNEFHPQRGDSMLQYSVCSFDIFTEEVYTTLCNGAALVIPPAQIREDIPAVLDFCAKEGITEISGFPYLLLEMNKMPERLPESLRLLISGGDVVREGYISNLKDKVLVYNTYGPTETTVCCSYYNCSAGAAEPDGTYPVGKPVFGTQIEILDENLKPLALGKVGEICVTGGGVTRGYFGPDRKKENEAFVTMKDGRRLYRTGDLGFMKPDGNIGFLHRKDTQVMILGKRVETCEVQNILCECKEVEKGVVTAGTDSQGLSFLTAYVVPSGKDYRESDVRAQMSRFLPDYMMPEFFVTLQNMPVNNNGKVDLKALPAIHKQGGLRI